MASCPTCGYERLSPHCNPEVSPSGACDLVKCGRCGSYGTPDGRRWHRERTPRAGAA